MKIDPYFSKKMQCFEDMYRLDCQMCIKFDIVDTLFIDFVVVNSIFIYKMVKNQNFKFVHIKFGVVNLVDLS